jgi:hypothetical protein
MIHIQMAAVSARAGPSAQIIVLSETQPMLVKTRDA